MLRIRYSDDRNANNVFVPGVDRHVIGPVLVVDQQE